MPTYRLYRLDGAGKIISAEWVEADSDELALAEAQTVARGAGVSYELWDRNRLVGKKPTGQP